MNIAIAGYRPLAVTGTQWGKPTTAANELNAFMRKHGGGVQYPAHNGSQGKDTLANLKGFHSSPEFDKLTPQQLTEFKRLVDAFAQASDGTFFAKGVNGGTNGGLKSSIDIANNAIKQKIASLQGSADGGGAGGAPGRAPGAGAADNGTPAPVPEETIASLRTARSGLSKATNWENVEKIIKTLFPSTAPQDLTRFNKLKTDIKKNLYGEQRAETADRDIDGARSEQELLQKLFDAGGKKKKIAIDLISSVIDPIISPPTAPAPRVSAAPTTTTTAALGEVEPLAEEAPLVSSDGTELNDTELRTEPLWSVGN